MTSGSFANPFAVCVLIQSLKMFFYGIRKFIPFNINKYQTNKFILNDTSMEYQMGEF